MRTIGFSLSHKVLSVRTMCSFDGHILVFLIQAMQKGHQRILTILSRVKNSSMQGRLSWSRYMTMIFVVATLNDFCCCNTVVSSLTLLDLRMYQYYNTVYKSVVHDLLFVSGSVKVMLLCGSDLLESFSKRGVWIPDQVQNLNTFWYRKGMGATSLNQRVCFDSELRCTLFL